jgi:hypothetical protein
LRKGIWGWIYTIYPSPMHGKEEIAEMVSMRTWGRCVSSFTGVGKLDIIAYG